MSAEGDTRAANGAEADGSEMSKDPALSYRYWVNNRGDGKEVAAPPPQPRKLTAQEAAEMHKSSSQGSLWNQGGTWEERTLNDWAKAKLTELLRLAEAVEVDGHEFQVSTELDSLSGDTTIVVVRNKKKHGYMLDINLKFKGRSESESERVLEGTMRIHEATFGDVDGIHLEVTVDAGKSGLQDLSKGDVESHLSRQLVKLVQARMEQFEGKLLER